MTAVVQHHPLDQLCESCGHVRVDHEVRFPDGVVFAICGACLPSSGIVPIPRGHT